MERIDPILNVSSLSLVKEHLERYNYALKKMSPNKVVADVACGTGYGSKILGAKASLVIGIDKDVGAICYAKDNYSASNVIFKCRDIEKNNLPKADIYVIFETIEHLKEPQKFISRVKEKTKEVFISTPIIPTKVNNKFHLHDLTEKDILDWFSDWKLEDKFLQNGIYLVAYFKK